MHFLNRLLDHPAREKPYILLGYPTDDCMVPDIGKKPLGEIASFY
ncbi:hypothetical protein ACEU07_14140 [Chromobacterium violaceum]